MRRYVGFLLLALAALATLPAAAQVAIILDFESFPGPDGRFGTADDVRAPTNCGSGVCARLSNEFAGAGIVFVSGTLSHFPLDPSRPGNHFVSSTPPDVRLSIPVYGVSVASRSAWTATIHAFDAAGTLIATNTLVHPAPGRIVVEDRLGVSTTVPIARFVILAGSCVPDGPFCDNILNLDDFILALTPTSATPTLPVSGIPVPTSSAWSTALLALFLAVFAGWRLRRSR